MQFSISPYGVLPEEFKLKGNNTSTVMTHWKPGADENDRVDSFNQWREEMLSEFIDALWPRYDLTTRSWVGKSTRFALQLTELDLHVLINEFLGANPKLNEKPISPLASTEIGTHLDHYTAEDEEAPGVNFPLYDKTLSEKESHEFSAEMHKAITTSSSIGTKSAGHFWFKAQMQRPRPLHTALLFKLENSFYSQKSMRGLHPSIVSGHCFQGIMMCCAVLERWLAENPKTSELRKNALGQFMVDIGDRRVYAGVHYPTDNIASWALALSLIPHVFSDATVISQFCRNSIQNYSDVYKAIQKHFFKHSEANPALHLLEKYGLRVTSPV